MKSKLICLVLCLACFLTMFASCGETDCDTHIDADKNSQCDNCGTPVYTIVEQVPTEETVVNMIVSEIPATATLGSVYSVDRESGAMNAFAEGFTAVDSTRVLSNNTLLYYVYRTQVSGTETTETNDDKYTDTHCLYSPLDAKVLVSYTTDPYTLSERSAGHYDTATLTVEAGFFLRLTVTDWSETWGYWDSETIESWYLGNGTKLYSSADLAVQSNDAPTDAALRGNCAYVTRNGVRCVYDVETSALLTSAPVDAFVDRPTFDFCTDAYGYVEYDGKIYVYDLSKWIDCVYAYECPTGSDTWILSNGSILVQRTVLLPEGTKNHDYVAATDTATVKYDLVHTVVDPIAKTETNLEFGYYIDSVTVAEDAKLSDAVKNVLAVRCIKDKNLDKSITLFCDDALAILGEKSAVLPNLVSNVELVADGVFLGTVRYDENTTVRKLYDANGAELATLPNSAVIYGSYIACNGNFYDFTMKLLLDTESIEATDVSTYNDYALITKDGDVYYWNSTLTAPVLAVDATNAVQDEATPNPLITKSLVVKNENYFVIKTTTKTVTGDDTTTTTEYCVYNAANQKVLTTETVPTITLKETEAGSYWIATTDNNKTVYFAK